MGVIARLEVKLKFLGSRARTKKGQAGASRLGDIRGYPRDKRSIVSIGRVYY